MAADEPLAYRPTDAARLIGISRSRLYELLARGDIAAKKVGGRTVVERSELVRYLAAAPDLDLTAGAR